MLGKKKFNRPSHVKGNNQTMPFIAINIDVENPK